MIDFSGFVRSAWSSAAPWAKTLRFALAPLSRIFALGVGVRSWFYDRGIVEIYRPEVPVVSVGNLTVGGSGKTPLVIHLVALLFARGQTPVVISRGYGGDSEIVTVVLPATGDAMLAPAPVEGELRVVRADDVRSQAADEAMLTSLRSGAVVVTCADRRRACRVAVAQLGATVLVLDDGFQHRRVARDLDIVLIGSEESSAAMLPAGPLREPLTALARADLVLITGSDFHGTARDVSAVNASLPVATLTRRAVGLVRDVGETVATIDPSVLQSTHVAAVAGIGHPDGFFAMLGELGARVDAAHSFADHHAYDARDWERIRSGARTASWIVTTEKDLVKLVRLGPADERMVALRLDVEVEPAQTLQQALDRLCAV